MELAIFLKFSQHNDLRDELLSTGEAELILVRATCTFATVEMRLSISVELGQRFILGLWAGWGRKK